MTSRGLPLPIIPTIRASTGVTAITAVGVQIDSQATNFGYPLINLNTLEPGNGSTNLSGFTVSRGPGLPKSVFVWSESDQTFRSGISESTERITTVSNAVTAPGFLRWDGQRFVATGTNFVTALNQNVATTASPTFQDVTLNALVVNGNRYSLPTTQGSNGTMLTNDGSGVLTWEVPAAIATSVSISDASGDTKISTQGITDDHTIYMKAGGQLIMTGTQNGSQFLQPLSLQSSLSMKSTDVFSTYTVAVNDAVLVYKGTSNATVTLPTIPSRQCRHLIFENLTMQIVNIAPAGINTIDGSPDALVLDINGSTASILSDGNNNWIVI